MPIDIAEVSVDREKQELQVFSKLTSSSAVPPVIHIVGAVVVIFIRNGDGSTDGLEGEENSEVQPSAKECQSTNAGEEQGQAGTKCIPASLSVLPAPAYLAQLPTLPDGVSHLDGFSLRSSGRLGKDQAVDSPSRALGRALGRRTQSGNESPQQNQEQITISFPTENVESSCSFQLQQQANVKFRSVDISRGDGSDMTADKHNQGACNTGEESRAEREGHSEDKEGDRPHDTVVKLEPLSPEPMDVSAPGNDHTCTREETATVPEAVINPCGSMVLQIKDDHIDSDEENFEVVTHVNVQDARNYNRDAGRGHGSQDSMSRRTPTIGSAQMGRRAVAKRGRLHGRFRPGAACSPRPATPTRLRHTHLTCTICQSAVRSYAELLHHISEHQNLSPRPLCPVCFEGFQDGVGLRRHAALHFPNPPVKCPICQMQYSHVESLRRHFQNSHPGQQVSLKRYLHRIALRGRTRPPLRSPRPPPELLPGRAPTRPSATAVTARSDADRERFQEGEMSSVAQNQMSWTSKDVASSTDAQFDGRREVSPKGGESGAVTSGGRGPCLSDLDPRVWECEAGASQKSSAPQPSASTVQGSQREVVVIDLDSGPEDENCEGVDILPTSELTLTALPSQHDMQGIMQDAVDRDGKVHGTCRRSIVNGKEQELYICNYCSQPFTRYGNFRRHLKSKHPQVLGYSAEEADKKFTCPVCLHDYNRSDNLKYHVRKKHPESYDLIFNSMSMNVPQEMSESKPSDSPRSQQIVPTWPLVPWDPQTHMPGGTQEESVRRSSSSSMPRDPQVSDRKHGGYETSPGQSWISQLSQPLGEAAEPAFRQDLPSKTEDPAPGASPCSYLGNLAAGHPELSSANLLAPRDMALEEQGSTSFNLPFSAGPGVSDAQAGRYCDAVAVASSQPVFPTHDQFRPVSQTLTLRNDKGESEGLALVQQEPVVSAFGGGYHPPSSFACGTASMDLCPPGTSSQEPPASQVPKAQRGKPSLASEEASGSKQRGPTQCSVCKDTISSRDQFAHHIKKHMLDVGDNVCPICLTSFSTYFNLLRHAARHLGTSSYTCPVCSNSINRLDNFKIHLKNHTDIPPDILAQLKAVGMDPGESSSN